MITLRYPVEARNDDLEESIYEIIESAGYDIYECFDEDYKQKPVNDMVAQFEGDYGAFMADTELRSKIEAIVPDIAFSDEEDR